MASSGRAKRERPVGYTRSRMDRLGGRVPERDTDGWRGAGDLDRARAGGGRYRPVTCTVRRRREIAALTECSFTDAQPLRMTRDGSRHSARSNPRSVTATRLFDEPRNSRPGPPVSQVGFPFLIYRRVLKRLLVPVPPASGRKEKEPSPLQRPVGLPPRQSDPPRSELLVKMTPKAHAQPHRPRRMQRG